MTRPTVRRAVLADIAAMTACYLNSWRAAYVDTFDPHTLDREADRRRDYDWATDIESHGRRALVAERGGHVIGVATARLDLTAPRDLPEVTMLYVVPTSWGSGAAQDLLRESETWIESRGATAARLRVVEAHTRARRFYERAGWDEDPSIEPVSNGHLRLISYRKQLA
ncbi:MAG: GNAT family N-acetyltransferase [Actinomycetota bacterium]